MRGQLWFRKHGYGSSPDFAKVGNRIGVVAFGVFRNKASSTDRAGTYQCLASGHSACRALLIFGERLNWVQWIGIALGFASLFLISRIGAKEGFSLKHSKWIWMSIGATVLGAVSALYDKYLLGYYHPVEVQAWYSLYQCFIMVGTILVLRRLHKEGSGFTWRWVTIPCIALFLTVADLAYFYSLSLEGSMVAIVSMIRRGSVIVSFIYGVVALHEKNIKSKLIDLCVLLLSLALLVVGSSL